MPDIIWNFSVIPSMRNLTTELLSLKVKKVVWLNFAVNLEPNFGIDNDKSLGGTPEGRILLKCTLAIVFQDLNYAAYTSRLWRF